MKNLLKITLLITALVVSSVAVAYNDGMGVLAICVPNQGHNLPSKIRFKGNLLEVTAGAYVLQVNGKRMFLPVAQCFLEELPDEELT